MAFDLNNAIHYRYLNEYKNNIYSIMMFGAYLEAVTCEANMRADEKRSYAPDEEAYEEYKNTDMRNGAVRLNEQIVIFER